MIHNNLWRNVLYEHNQEIRDAPIYYSDSDNQQMADITFAKYFV